MTEKHRIESPPENATLESARKEKEGSGVVVSFSYPDERRNRRLVLSGELAAEVLGKYPMGSKVFLRDVVEISGRPDVRTQRDDS